MIFPFTRPKSTLDPFDPVGRIDREVGERPRRLGIGLWLQPDFRSILGALIVSEGKGKYFKVIRAITCSETVPASTSEILTNLCRQSEISPLDLHAIRTDISLVQQSLVSRLKNDAGKYLDRLLAISIYDAGLQNVDENVAGMIPICDPVQLADATTISVIDAFGQRDVANGGTGQGLFTIPAWLCLADRSLKISSKNRLLIVVHDTIDCYFLPASDGLDTDFPAVDYAAVPGLSALAEITGIDSFDALADLNVSGSFNTLIEKQICLEKPHLIAGFELHDVVRTSVVCIVNRVVARAKQLAKNESIDEVFVDCALPVQGTIVNQIIRELESANLYTKLPFQNQQHAGHANAILTAVLGAISIDQMPANVPWITGATSPKILGRLTPGSPMNWRQLLKDMSDFQPPAMRLKDAI